MYQAGSISFYLIKYFSLALGLLSLLISLYKDWMSGTTEWLDTFISLIVCIVGVLIYIVWLRKLRQVAVSRMKLLVEEEGIEKEYSWLDVEFIDLNQFTRLYELKIKNKDSIYFLPYGHVSLLMGDQSEMGDIINKHKKDLSI
jgi:cell division protein FtsL